MAKSNTLIVDDERNLRETLKEIFEVSGFSGVTASSGEEALDVLAKQRKPCLFWLDLMMPVMNNWEFMTRLKRESRKLSMKSLSFYHVSRGRYQRH